MDKPHIIIREVATGKTHIVRVPVGYSCPADEEYRWAGFFESVAEAEAAIKNKDASVQRQLDGPARTITGTPGPESIASLFRIKRGR